MTDTHDDFELKRALDTLPRSIEPPDDLWPRIRAGLADARRPAPPRQWTAVGVQRLRIAALLTLLAVSAGALVTTRRAAGQWRLALAASAAQPFRVGDELATGARTAQLTVGTIGEVDVAPGTDVRLLAARWSEHRLALTRGTIHARISAPPRLFIVETPTGIAVDMGCEYSLEVDSTGDSRLVVTAGWVEFSQRGRTSLIPAGFSARARRGSGIGTPVADDAPAPLAAAVRVLDDSGMANDSALGVILATARPRDAVTLWHVLSGWRGGAVQRGRVFDRLATLVPPPVAGAGLAAADGDPLFMKVWWEKLPGTLPIVPAWQERLWRLWLRVLG